MMTFIALLASLLLCGAVHVTGGIINAVALASDSASCTVQTGIEYLGIDTNVAPPISGSSKDDCCAACSTNEKCSFYTFDKSTSTCQLKNANAPDTSKPNENCTSGYPGESPPAPPAPESFEFSVDTRATRWETSKSFICYNIDASANRGFFWRNLSQDGTLGAQLARQAAAISLAQEGRMSYLRFGGSGNDYLTYAVGDQKCPPLSTYSQCMNETTWLNLLDFADAAHAKIILGLSLNTGHDLGGPFPYPWDPKNAKKLLQSTIAKGKSHVLAGFELGNEQNTEYTPKMTANDLAILHNMTKELKLELPFWGPDPHSVHGPGESQAQFKWIGEFIDEAKKLALPIKGVTHHEYIEVDPSPNGFTSPARLWLSGTIAHDMNHTISVHAGSAKRPGVFEVWGGEIGPHNGGSPPCDHSSMRWATFGDSLW